MKNCNSNLNVWKYYENEIDIIEFNVCQEKLKMLAWQSLVWEFKKVWRFIAGVRVSAVFQGGYNTAYDDLK